MNERTPKSTKEAGAVERALYLPGGAPLGATAGRLWVFGDDLLLRRRGRKRPIAKLSRLRAVERVHDDWLDQRRYRFHASDGRFGLAPLRDGGDLEAFVAAVARQAGLEIADRESEPVFVGHWRRSWRSGLAGKALLSIEAALFAALLLFAYGGV